MGTIVSVLFLACCLALAARHWQKLYEEPAEGWRTLAAWIVKGLLVPLLLWIIFNFGLSRSFPPLWPAVLSMRANGTSWFGSVAIAALVGFFVLASHWTAVTFGWMTVIIGMRTQNRSDFKAFALIGSILIGPMAGLIFYYGGLTNAGLALSLWLVPIIHFTIADARPRKILPMYSRAIARMKFGKYHEAETEVIRQLEKCEADFDGWMMLADLYAKHFHDLPQADQTIRELCLQPGVNEVQISTALNRLADWHLSLGNDPEAACAALAELCRRLPGTHAARMAQTRISQLPATREELQQQREARPVRLPALQSNFEETEENTSQKLSRSDALVIANDCTERLKRDPNNVAARERFAMTLAENLGKTDLALDQLELLLGMPGQPEKKIAEWLGLMAAWLLHYRRDEEAARRILERIIREHPQSAQAFAAQRRLSLLEMEQRIKAGTQRGELNFKGVPPVPASPK